MKSRKRRRMRYIEDEMGEEEEVEDEVVEEVQMKEEEEKGEKGRRREIYKGTELTSKHATVVPNSSSVAMP